LYACGAVVPIPCFEEAAQASLGCAGCDESTVRRRRVCFRPKADFRYDGEGGPRWSGSWIVTFAKLDPTVQCRTIMADTHSRIRFADGNEGRTDRGQADLGYPLVCSRLILTRSTCSVSVFSTLSFIRSVRALEEKQRATSVKAAGSTKCRSMPAFTARRAVSQVQ
jgi:hypothetical protein